MSERENQQLVQELFSAINRRDLERYVKAHAENYVWEMDAFPQPIRGHDGLRKVLGMYFAAFPDLRMDVEELITSGDHTVVRWRATGTHNGEFNGVAATNKRIEARGCTVSEVKNGRVQKSATYSDQLSLMRQLGMSLARAAGA